MIGRAAYSNPYLLSEIQAKYFLSNTIKSRDEIIHHFIPYVREQIKKGVRLNNMTRHILGLFQGQRGAAIWRRYLSQHAHKQDANVNVIHEALSLVVNN